MRADRIFCSAIFKNLKIKNQTIIGWANAVGLALLNQLLVATTVTVDKMGPVNRQVLTVPSPNGRQGLGNLRKAHVFLVGAGMGAAGRIKDIEVQRVLTKMGQGLLRKEARIRAVKHGLAA